MRLKVPTIEVSHWRILTNGKEDNTESHAVGLVILTNTTRVSQHKPSTILFGRLALRSPRRRTVEGYSFHTPEGVKGSM